MNAVQSTTKTEPVWVYLGLGSNLDNPPQQLQEGLNLIEKEFDANDLQVSPTVKTPPMGGKEQPDYYNLVCRFKSAISPPEILECIQKIEDLRGRTREEHWGSRTLDIDILLVGDLVQEDQNLTIPHPGIPNRSFVIGPLLELEPELVDPKVGLSYRQLWNQLPPEEQSSLEKVL